MTTVGSEKNNDNYKKKNPPNDSSNADFQTCYALTKQESMTVLLTGTQPWKETTDAKHSLLLETTCLASPNEIIKGDNQIHT